MLQGSTFNALEIEKTLDELEFKINAYKVMRDTQDKTLLNRRAAFTIEELQNNLTAYEPQMSKTILEKKNASANLRLKELFNWLSGASVKGYSKSWGLYAVVYLMLWILMVYVGLEEGYFSNHTFGSNGFQDYMGLFLWGLGGTATIKTLFSLKQ